MLVFGALLSPYVRKVCVAAAEKGLDYQLKISRPRDPDPDFLIASPFGKIPAIKDGDFTLCDSTAILAYLDAKHPAPRLIPADAEPAGRAMWFDEYADTIVGHSGLKVLFNRFVGPKIFKVPGDEAIAEQGMAELPAIWAYLEGVAPAEGWLAGATFSIGDIAVASMIRSLAYVSAAPDAAAYPAIAAWYARVCARPAWRLVAEQEAATTPRTDKP